MPYPRLISVWDRGIKSNSSYGRGSVGGATVRAGVAAAVAGEEGLTRGL